MIGKTHRQVLKVFRELDFFKYRWRSMGFSDDHRRRTIDCDSVQWYPRGPPSDCHVHIVRTNARISAPLNTIR